MFLLSDDGIWLAFFELMKVLAKGLCWIIALCALLHRQSTPEYIRL
jgi:hypothetical protein